MPRKPEQITKLRVSNPDFSECGSCAIGKLDFSRWWTDGGKGSFSKGIYLHVPEKGSDADGAVHRVFCRLTDNPRLSMERGILYWIVK